MVKILNFDRKKQVLLKNNKKAFSIAEAFIMLTVASVALAAAAPMITKQIKHNNLSSVQTNILGREIDRAENIINTTNENIREIIGPGRTPEQYAQYVANLEARISALEGVDIESLRKDINGNINSINSSIKEIDTQLSSKADINAIEDLKDKIEEKSIPKGTIAFFNKTRCYVNALSIRNTYNLCIFQIKTIVERFISNTRYVIAYSHCR